MNMNREGFSNVIFREILSLKRFNHPNVIACKEILEVYSDELQSYAFCLVMEKMTCTLMDLLLYQSPSSSSPSSPSSSSSSSSSHINPTWSLSHLKYILQQILRSYSPPSPSPPIPSSTSSSSFPIYIPNMRD